MSAIDWTDMYRKYAGMWVAIDAADEMTVLVAGKDARKVHSDSQRLGRPTILHRVPEEVVEYA